MKFNFYNYSVCFTKEDCNEIMALNLKHQSYLKLNKNVLYTYIIFLHNIYENIRRNLHKI